MSSHPAFAHLHLHSQYSLLQGASKIKGLIQKAKSYDMKWLALTDLGNLFGAIDFYLACKEAGIQPIIGCELLYTHIERVEVQTPALKAKPPVPGHLVVLCMNLDGYRNLCQILTQAYLDPDLKGTVTRDLLEKYGEHLIVLSGCMRGPIGIPFFKGKPDDATSAAEWFKKRFGDRFYLELQDHEIPEQESLNEFLFQLSRDLSVECVATTDCHYIEPGHAESHEVLQCIALNKNLDLDRAKSLVPQEYYFKSPELMQERFEKFQGAFENTVKIAERCKLEFEFKDKAGKPVVHLPDFRPEGISEGQTFDVIAYFKEESLKGLLKRFQEPWFEEKVKAPNWNTVKAEYHARLDYELEMIIRTGFEGYFLIVADFIGWAKRHGIPVGPGRGSGAGSLVAYSLGITDVDPREFHLLFERFINPERVSMPDFDVDFCQDRRGEVIEYVTKKYGADRVCQIITFGKLQARNAIKDVARVVGLTFAEADQITKLIPSELGITIADAIEKERALKDLMSSDSRVAKVIEYSLAVEGLLRNPGMHAAGVIITNKPVVNYCPLYVGPDGAMVTQFDKDFSEKIGLVKFDFLGLKTLTVIDQAIRLIHQDPEHRGFLLERINYRDSKVYDLISSGDTNGVFQVESSGMKDLCQRIKPNSLEDLTAINALFRPGPLGSGMVDDFIECKHGRKTIEYEFPELESILKDTYGVILYQEQVMQIARDLAGYSLGQADMLRRAMGKKKPEEMAKHKEIFLEGASKKGFDRAKAEKIFDLMAKFAEYGFNKSHSVAYAFLTYQTAYLKTYFKEEFMASLMTTEMSSTETLAKYLSDARDRGVVVLPPDVNRSVKTFCVERLTSDSEDYPKHKKAAGGATPDPVVKAVRFGLEALKGVGGAAVDAILEARNGEQGPFKDVFDFAGRIANRKVNKKVLEALISAGALDQISDVNRATLHGSVEALLEHAAGEQDVQALGQSSLFDQFESDSMAKTRSAKSVFQSLPDWTNSEKLMKEKAVVGVYLSGHPMETWQMICSEWLGWTTEKVLEYAKAQSEKPAAQPKGQVLSSVGYSRPQRKEIMLAGLLTEFREVTAKKGKNVGRKMAFGWIEDLKGRVEIALFPDAFEKCQAMLREGLSRPEPILLHAELDMRDEMPKLLPLSMEWLVEAHEARVKKMTLKLNPSEISVEQLRELKKNLLDHRGRCTVRFEFLDKGFKTEMKLPESYKVDASQGLIASVNKIFGRSVVSLE